MLLKPHIKLEKITDITVSLLQLNGIKGLILDVDNTLSTHHGEKLTEGLTEWLDTMRNNGVKMIILSNSKRSRVKPFSERINLEYISLGLKPLPFNYNRATRLMNIPRNQVAIVGDQIFTDSLGGHLAGVKTIILDPIKPELMLGFRLRRSIERFLYKIYRY